MKDTVNKVKCVVVGDGNAGKTSLLIRFITKRFPDGYSVAVMEPSTTQLKVDGRTTELELWDTAGQETYDRLRPLSYRNTDIFLVCFALDNPKVFDNVEDKWLPEIRHHCPETPFILVGTKLDLRNDLNDTQENCTVGIKYIQGVATAKLTGAAKYVECSALTQEGLGDVFDELVRAIHHTVSKPKMKKKCNVL